MQVRNNLPMLGANLEKLKNHYSVNMPKINLCLVMAQAWLTELESSKMVYQGTNPYSRGCPDGGLGGVHRH